MSSEIKTYIDLFCGIGGFRWGLSRYDIDCVFANDVDKDAMYQYENNFDASCNNVCEDIRKIEAKDIPKHDMITAGFPCQPFTLSGNHKGTGDSNGLLYKEIVRIAEYHKPKLILMENVPGFVRLQKSKYIKEFIKDFESIGYEVFYKILSSSCYRIPQRRDRVYIICVPIDSGENIMFMDDDEPKFSPIDSILERGFVDKDLYLKRPYLIFGDDSKTKLNHSPKRIGIIARYNKFVYEEGSDRDEKIISLRSRGQGTNIYSTKSVGITCNTKKGGDGYYLTDTGVRKLTITEYKRMMGFPDYFNVSDGGEGYKQLGNAVIPGMVRQVVKMTKINRFFKKKVFTPAPIRDYFKF